VIDALRDAQRDSDLTVEQLAQAVEISRRQLHRYWTGEAGMPLWVAVGLAEVLSVDLCAVLAGAGA